jgi:hypothetical protein
MASASHFSWQLVLYGMIAFTYAGVAASLLDARTTPRKWLAGSYLLLFSESVVAFPMAVSGYDPYEWLLGHPQTTQYLALVLTSMWITLVAMVVFARNSRLPRLVGGLPPFRASESRIRQSLILVSLVCALLSLAFSAGGYHGYYLADEYFYEPPPWRDIVGSIIGTGAAINFVLLLFGYVTFGRIRGPERLLLLLWAGAGLANGFKSQVVFPFFYALVAAWLANQLRARHWAFFAIAVVVAYSVVEPMREWRWSAGHDNSVRGVYELTTTGSLTVPKLDDVALAFMARLDSAEIAVQALEADQFGQITGYRERLNEAYRYLPALTFVPRVLWPGKPLANHGGELSVELLNVSKNSVDPSAVVDSYLWGGYIGVVFNSILTAYCLTLAGRLITNYKHQPLRYLPALLLVPVLAMPPPIRAFYYITLLRAFVGTALFYGIARRVGLVRNDGPALPALRPIPNEAAKDHCPC